MMTMMTMSRNSSPNHNLGPFELKIGHRLILPWKRTFTHIMVSLRLPTRDGQTDRWTN